MAILILLSQAIPTQSAAPELIAEFQIGGGSGQSLALNKAGTLLASTGDEGDLLLYDIASQHVLWRRQPDHHWMGATVFSPDGSLIASVGDELVIYNLAGDLVFSTPASGRACAAWNQAGTLFAYQCANKTMRVLETENWSAVRTLPPVPYPANSVNFTADSKKLLIGCNARYILRFDLEASEFDLRYQRQKNSSGGQTIRQVVEVKGSILSAQSSGLIQLGEKSFATNVSLYDSALTPDGNGLAICGGFPEVHVYNFEGELLRKLETGFTAPTLSFAAERNLLAVGTSSGAIQLWDDFEKVQELFLHPSEPKRLAFSADSGSILAVGKLSYFFDLHAKKGVSLPGARSCTSGNSGNEIVCLEKGGVVIRNGSNGKVLRKVPLKSKHLDTNRKISLSPDGQSLALGRTFSAYDYFLVDLTNGNQKKIPGSNRTVDTAWTPDSQIWAVGGASGQHGESGGLHLYSMPDGKESAGERPRVNNPIQSVCISPTGSRMVFCQSEGSIFDGDQPTIHLWDLHLGQEIEFRWGDYSYLRFLDDSTLLALSYRKPYAQFLDAVTLQPKGLALDLPVSYTSTLSPDGKRLALTDKTWVRIYELPARD